LNVDEVPRPAIASGGGRSRCPLSTHTDWPRFSAGSFRFIGMEPACLPRCEVSIECHWPCADPGPRSLPGGRDLLRGLENVLEQTRPLRCVGRPGCPGRGHCRYNHPSSQIRDWLTPRSQQRRGLQANCPTPGIGDLKHCDRGARIEVRGPPDLLSPALLALSCAAFRLRSRGPA
jgi:hypothetical protein